MAHIRFRVLGVSRVQGQKNKSQLLDYTYWWVAGNKVVEYMGFRV